MTATRGVYFLANDRVLDWTKGFLHSFRAHNPELSLCLIPFNGACEAVKKLQARYRFTSYDDLDMLHWCDEVARRFHHTFTPGHYRKMACWHGPFEQFLYIDIDTIILQPVEFVFDLLLEHDVVVAKSDLPELFEWVWKPTIHHCSELSQKQIGFSANTGFFASRNGLLSPRSRPEWIETALGLADHMELLCAEQPLLNYLLVTSGLRLQSLTNLGPAYPQEFYGGTPGATVSNGTLRYAGDTPLFVHWPGVWSSPWYWEPWRKLSVLLGRRPRGSEAITPRLPYRKLWSYHFNPDDA